MKRLFAVGLCLGLVCLSGCGEALETTYPAVTGKLTMDGKPFGPANVVLTLANQPVDHPRKDVGGSVDKDGNITFMMYKPGDGAAAGDYKVIVSPAMMGGKPIPQIYTDIAKTTLKAKVEAKSEPQVITIEMNSKAGPLTATPLSPGMDPSVALPGSKTP